MSANLLPAFPCLSCLPLSPSPLHHHHHHQISILIPVEVIRLGLQFAAYPYADIMLDTLNSALTIGEILFLLATLGYTFIDLSAYYLPEIAFGAVIFLTCVPTFIVFVYELGNLYLTYRIKKGEWVRLWVWGLGLV